METQEDEMDQKNVKEYKEKIKRLEDIIKQQKRSIDTLQLEKDIELLSLRLEFS